MMRNHFDVPGTTIQPIAEVLDAVDETARART
jgi:hypothetical protein